MRTRRHLFDIYLHHSSKLSMSQSSETYEMQASTGPPNTSNDVDQDDQVWRDVKAETGFSSYQSYVKTLVQSGRYFISLQRFLGHTHLRTNVGMISVFDIQKDGSTVTSLNAGHSEAELSHLSQDFEPKTVHKISTRILQTLRSSPEDIPARIVLWSMPREFHPHPSIIEALGLGLDIDPSFFETLFQMTLSHHMISPMRSNQFMIGDSVATVARDYRRDRHDPTVLVVAGYFELHYGFPIDGEMLDKPYNWVLEEVMNQEISGGTSLFSSAFDKVPQNDFVSVSSNYYLKLLSIYVDKNRNVDSEVDVTLMIAILPLLRLEILRLRGQCGVIDSVLKQVQYGVERPGRGLPGRNEERYSLLDRNRFWLRRRLEGLQESRDAFQSFARSQNAANWLGTKIWLNQDADIREALSMARSRELEARDFMQLQIGNLSISESRKSIQLSNQQMDEAKRGKSLSSRLL